MSMCPLCNSFKTVTVFCENCKTNMDDQGRLIDYFDDYSAYLDIDGMKLFDGIENDLKNKECPHVFYCLNCHTEKTILINEIEEASE